MRTRILLPALVGVCIFTFILAVTAVAREAGAIEGTASITDYANYPANSGTAPDCDASGVHGVEYTLNGVGPIFDLSELPAINQGDILEVSYTDVADACNTPDSPQPIVLSMKSTAGGEFDPTVDQKLELPYAFDWMGPIGGRFTYVMPNLGDDSFEGCSGQLDLIVGLPLDIVGPSGSYYSASLNGQKQMLIDSWNGEYDVCQLVPPPPPPVETTTTVAATPTTVTETPATVTVLTSPSTNSEVEVQTLSTLNQGQSVTQARALAETGPGCTLIASIIGGILLLLAFGAFFLGRYFETRKK